MQTKTKINGFTIIEMIIYFSIVSVILTLIVRFNLDALNEKSQQQIKQTVEQDADFVFKKITREIETAVKINKTGSEFGNNTNNGKIILNKADGTVVTISSTGGAVYYQVNTEAQTRISSEDTEITVLQFLTDKTAGKMVTGIQVKLHAKAKEALGQFVYEKDFQTTVVPKITDSDNDGVPDSIDQFPLDAGCTKDTDGDGICDEKDNCKLVHNTDQQDDDDDGIGTACDDYVDIGGSDDEEGTPDEDGKVTICHYPPGHPENKHTLKVGQGAVQAHLTHHGDTLGPCEQDVNEDEGKKRGGMWEGENTVDSCLYTCNQTNPLWQQICQKFECFYTGNRDDFETNEDNEQYAGVGQILSEDTESMYWKKKFILDFPAELIPQIDRFEFYLNYCHSGSRLWTWWRQARCSGLGYYLNGYFVGDQNLELYNYDTNQWDVIGKLDAILTNNQKINGIFQYSNNVQDYININGNNEVTARINFIANGAPWGDPQRWDFLAPARYLLIDYFTLEAHIQGTSTCGDKIVEGDEQCDDGSHCADGTDCTSSGSTVCAGIGDELCKPRTGFGNNCSSTCLNENAVCGNSLTEMGEECDDGKQCGDVEKTVCQIDSDCAGIGDEQCLTRDLDGCSSQCKIERCGNHLTESPEECDTGKRCDQDGLNCDTDLECAGIGDAKCAMRDGDDDNCSAVCLNEICGNGRLDANEECDDGNLTDGDGCNSICHFENCGNGIQDTGEECDDGNSNNGDDCNNNCQIQICGDGAQNRSVEECDDGKQCGDDEKTVCQIDSDCAGIGDEQCLTRDLDGCDATCKLEFAVCGNGQKEGTEECDDGNTNDGDNCSHTCMNEYIASYDFTNPAQNGLNQARTAWVVYSKNSALPSGGPAWNIVNNFSFGNPSEQMEFNQIDSLIPQTSGTSYTQIKSSNDTHFVLSGTNNNYFLHKFDFKIGENEFKTSETTPKRIEKIEVVWEGFPKWISGKSRTIKVYIWKSNAWTQLASNTWSSSNAADLTLTAPPITSSIGSYIDANRKVYILVNSDYKNQDMINTDQIQLNVKAYKYRDGYE